MGADVEPQPPRYDADAAQDAVTDRGHFGNTVPEGFVYFSQETCQTCGIKRVDHRLRGHDFVQWERNVCARCADPREAEVHDAILAKPNHYHAFVPRKRS